MSLDPMWLFLSLISSGIGFVMFVYGKKLERWPQMAGGLALIVYPYFAPTIEALVGIGAVICVVVWYAVRAGW